jgi:hypothetical protein
VFQSAPPRPDILKLPFPDLVVSKRKLRLADAIACVRMKRQEANQILGFTSRPFILCGLPVKRPRAGERRNGHFLLQVTGHPSYGLPWGQDRLVPIFLATQAIRQKSPQILFESAAEMLSTFGMQQGGSQYPPPGRVVPENLRRDHLFRDRFSVGAGGGRSSRAIQFHDGSSHLVFPRSRAKAAAGKIARTGSFSATSSTERFRRTRFRTDLEAARALSSSPAALDLFMWLSYRCFTARGKERVPLFGAFGLVSQLGRTEYARPRKFREKLEGWLNLIRAMWPECPARIDDDGTGLFVDRATAEARTLCIAPNASRAEMCRDHALDAGQRHRPDGERSIRSVHGQPPVSGSIYLAKRVGRWSLSQIGRFYNGRHHTTVLHAVEKIENLRRTDEAVDAC